MSDLPTPGATLPTPPRDGGTAETRWDRLSPLRLPFLLRAYDCAKQTIPSLLPPIGSNSTSKLPQPYQGLGARGTENLANRLTMAMLPAGANHFRLGIPAKVLVKQSPDLQIPEDLNHQIAVVENLIQEDIDRLNWRQATNMIAQHLVVTGNAFEYEQPDGNIRVYRLDQFIVVRDCYGRLTEFITREQFSADSLPEKLRGIAVQESKEGSGTKDIPLYTWGTLQGDGSWKVHQELCDEIVPQSQGSYKAGTLPFWHLRWSAVVGEDYGRGKIEAHFPDLVTLDGLTKALREGAAMAARNITMIRPNAAGGLNLRRRIASANNGEQIIGNPEDVNMLQFQNTAGMQFVAQEVGRLTQELGAAFLLNSAMRRDAERVTATELRQMAEELDGSLGGIYTILSQEMALPRLERRIFQMQSDQALPNWPHGMVQPVVLTGIEALGRERDIQRIGMIFQLMQNLPQEVVQEYPKWSKLLDRAFVAAGLPECVNTEQEVQALQKQQALIQALQQAAPTMADKMLPSADAQQPGQPSVPTQ